MIRCEHALCDSVRGAVKMRDESNAKRLDWAVDNHGFPVLVELFEASFRIVLTEERGRAGHVFSCALDWILLQHGVLDSRHLPLEGELRTRQRPLVRVRWVKIQPHAKLCLSRTDVAEHVRICAKTGGKPGSVRSARAGDPCNLCVNAQKAKLSVHEGHDYNTR